MLKNLKIKTRLYVSSGIAILFIAIIGITGYLGMEKMEANVDDLASNDAKLVEYAQRERANINMLRRYEKDLFMNIGDSAKMDEYKKKWDTTLEHFNKRMDESAKLLSDPSSPDGAKDKETLSNIKKNMDSYGKSGFVIQDIWFCVDAIH